MDLHFFDPETGRYAGSKQAELDEWQSEVAGKPCYRGEANATWDAPEPVDGCTPYFKNGVWVNVPDPTPEEQQAMLIGRFRSAIQSWMDGEAVKLGYDSILSACSYINTGNPKFDAEGEGFRQWRSAVWAKGYALIDEVIAGQREVPDDPADVIALLPELSIVYPEAD